MEIKVSIELGEKTLGILTALFEALPTPKNVQNPPVASAAPTKAAPVEETSPTPVPTTAISYTLDDLTKAAATLMDKGKIHALQELVKDFGVMAMQELPIEKYGEFAIKLRELGASI